ncbi:TetR/AcrR family transcriptional regulator [Sphingomonas cavernae]|uniref:TetR/AcrR family transcriptional regulator n=1 Tax=Sphingomonas cavernae TaxID=2320861 RepID=A0A418WKU3_9SPHN|nr:TetR/AcrR family transcriptional regulator [Sphingomonas cavernae]RJF90562.1 TetR/AcrR family transcriptional regulator [Sphingomonas cavernae]
MSRRARKQLREDPEVRRQQILDAAIQVIGQRGYHGFTIQELAARCGLTNGGLLYYFGSKERLLISILEERDRRESVIVHATAELTQEESQQGVLSLARVRKLFRIIVEREVGQPELLRLFAVLQAEALDPAHPAHDFFLRREAMVIDEFSRMVAPHVEHPRVVARQILALLDGLAQQWLRVDGAFDLVSVWDDTVAALFPARTQPGGQERESTAS